MGPARSCKKAHFRCEKKGEEPSSGGCGSKDPILIGAGKGGGKAAGGQKQKMTCRRLGDKILVAGKSGKDVV